MIKYKSGKLSKKDTNIIKDILTDVTDVYGDGYITRNNLRLFLKENTDLLFDGVEKGDKIVYDENKGLIFITGWSDKANRKYIKVLAKNEESADHLLKIVGWHTTEVLWAKVKKNNPIRRILQKNGFCFAGDRGKEILMCRNNIYTTKVEKKEKIEGDQNA